MKGIRYPLTLGAVMLRDLGKSHVEVSAALGDERLGSGVSSWTHGRWRPSPERRTQLNLLYGIPVLAWEEIVREPAESDMRAILQERVNKRIQQRKNYALRHGLPVPASMPAQPPRPAQPEIAGSIDSEPKHSRTLGAMALEAIGLEKIEKSLASSDSPNSLRQSIAGWISGKWLPTIARQRQLESMWGVPQRAWSADTSSSARARGNSAGGKNAAAQMTKEQRVARGRLGAEVRWGKAAQKAVQKKAAQEKVVQAKAAQKNAAQTPLDWILSCLTSKIITQEQATAILLKLGKELG